MKKILLWQNPHNTTVPKILIIFFNDFILFKNLLFVQTQNNFTFVSIFFQARMLEHASDVS